jgi:diguanylate cyclase (GGDEF)-like protein
MDYSFMVNTGGLAMRSMKKKSKVIPPKTIKRRKSGERAGTKPDRTARVKRGKSHGGSPPKSIGPIPADPKPAIRRLRSQLAEALSRIDELEASADTDFLLDIPNRRGFERELNRSIAYIKRYHASGALIVLDVDRLKPINDAYGHAAGDEVLKAIVAVLLRHVRSSDVIGRLGGDEFALLLWNLSETDAHAKAASLEQAVDALSFTFRGRRISAGASAGVAILGIHAEAGKALEEADSAMYVRKAQRRHEG